jgi:segregation and condensation protein A
MTSLAQNAIALLIELAECGDIDPWDVQVIEVIDRFLSQLQPAAVSGRTAYEADLSQSGQAFLYASMLVLLKADSLARLESDAAAADSEAIETLEVENTGTPLPLHLERRLHRRAVARPPQNRRVTLPELIAQLELMAATVAEQQPRPRTRRPRPHSRAQAVRTIAQLAHQENLSEVAAAIEKFLTEHWEQISQGEDWMDFELLLDQWSTVGSPDPDCPSLTSSIHQNMDASENRVAVFWALLFLSAQSKVELAQEEFYQDLKVRSLSTDETIHPDLSMRVAGD